RRADRALLPGARAGGGRLDARSLRVGAGRAHLARGPGARRARDRGGRAPRRRRQRGEQRHGARRPRGGVRDGGRRRGGEAARLGAARARRRHRGRRRRAPRAHHGEDAHHRPPAAGGAPRPRGASPARRDGDAAAVLISCCEEVMALFKRGGGVQEFPTVAREVYDVTGAGDTVLATCALALGAGGTLEEATVLANHAAGVVVGKIGTATLRADELRATLRGRRPTARAVGLRAADAARELKRGARRKPRGRLSGARAAREQRTGPRMS